MFNARTEELIKALEPYKGKRVFVAVLGSPDPDGLASAWALQILAREIGVSMDLLTFEVISRPDNVTFAKILDIPFRQVTDHLPRAGYAGYAVVDRQNVGLPVPHKARLPVIAHIDHHASVATDAVFMQQETSIGSTCSIMAFHLQYLLKNSAIPPAELCRLATALMHGIRTDTADFVTCNPVDFEAAAILAPHVSIEHSYTLVNAPLGKAFIDTLTTVLQSCTKQNGIIVSYAGKISRRARDTIAQSADFLMRTEDTETVVVFGLINDNFVGSLRSSSPIFDPYDFLDTALSTSLKTPVDCGGRTFAGGFQIPLKLMPTPDIEASRQLIQEMILNEWSIRSAPKPKGSRKKKGGKKV